MLKSFILLLSLWAGSSLALAQAPPLPDLQLNVSYFGEFFTHPGLRLGVDKPLSSRVKEKRSGREVTKGWTTGGAMTLYHHKRNHTGLLLTGRIGRQRLGTRGLITEYHAELGYLRSWLDGEVYEASENTFTEGSAGSSHAVFGFNGGVGWNLSPSFDIPFAVTFKPHLWFQVPFNTWVLPHLSAELNVKYFLR